MRSCTVVNARAQVIFSVTRFDTDHSFHVMKSVKVVTLAIGTAWVMKRHIIRGTVYVIYVSPSEQGVKKEFLTQGYNSVLGIRK